MNFGPPVSSFKAIFTFVYVANSIFGIQHFGRIEFESGMMIKFEDGQRKIVKPGTYRYLLFDSQCFDGTRFCFSSK